MTRLALPSATGGVLLTDVVMETTLAQVGGNQLDFPRGFRCLSCNVHRLRTKICAWNAV